MIFFSITPVVLPAITCSFISDSATFMINFTATVVVLPDAVEPSRNSALAGVSM